MGLSVKFYNVPEAYSEMIRIMNVFGIPQSSRNGDVLMIPEPVTMTIESPRERVLFDPERNANPFFHLMEAIWMLAGENDVSWLLRFNKGFDRFAEADGIQRGAYGHRWRYHFGHDQIQWAVNELRSNPHSRRVVLSMWDPGYDSIGAPRDVKDLPCNTHIYVRILHGELEFTVCNRSNDMIWGMLGANCVHMTILQEVMAHALGVQLGKYTVFTNNLHVYKNLPNYTKLMMTLMCHDPYSVDSEMGGVAYRPIEFKDLTNFLTLCKAFVHGAWDYIQDGWLRDVAMPVYLAWAARKEDKEAARHFISKIKAEDWRNACNEWMDRHAISSSVTSMEPSPLITTESITSERIPKTEIGTPTSPPAKETSPTTPSSN